MKILLRIEVFLEALARASYRILLIGHIKWWKLKIKITDESFLIIKINLEKFVDLRNLLF